MKADPSTGRAITRIKFYLLHPLNNAIIMLNNNQSAF